MIEMIKLKKSSFVWARQTNILLFISVNNKIFMISVTLNSIIFQRTIIIFHISEIESI